MKNTGQIIRSKKNGKSRYTAVSNSIIQDNTMTLDERMTLIYLLSLPEDWIVYKTEIWKRMNVGRDRFYKIWKVLEERGYIISEKQTNSLGQIIGYNHVVYEEPNTTQEQPKNNLKQPTLLPEIQETGFQYTENQVPETQVVNKVIRKQSNKKESNNIKNNNIINSSTNTGEKFDKEDIDMIMTLKGMDRNEAIEYLLQLEKKPIDEVTSKTNIDLFFEF